jgi:hypothetical protein
MTCEEYEAKARWVLENRTLKEHQIQDVEFSVGIVHRKGRVTSLDEYYLDSVGIFRGGTLVKIKPAPKKAIQQKLW